MKAFGTSTVATLRRSRASVVAVTKIELVFTVGLEVSSLPIQLLWVLPSPTVLALTSPVFFSTRNINDSSDRSISTGSSVDGSIGAKQTLSCSCFISLRAAAVALSPHFFIALLSV